MYTSNPSSDILNSSLFTALTRQYMLFLDMSIILVYNVMTSWSDPSICLQCLTTTLTWVTGWTCRSEHPPRGSLWWPRPPSNDVVWTRRAWVGPQSSQRTSRNRKFVVFHVCVHDSLIPITLVRRISEFFVTLIFLLNSFVKYD